MLPYISTFGVSMENSRIGKLCLVLIVVDVRFITNKKSTRRCFCFWL